MWKDKFEPDPGVKHDALEQWKGLSSDVLDQARTGLKWTFCGPLMLLHLCFLGPILIPYILFRRTKSKRWKRWKRNELREESQKKMFVLIRNISSYSGPDRLLGIFKTKEEAKKAKKTYIELCKKNDPWKVQGYVDAVNLEEDVLILDKEDIETLSEGAIGKTVYLVCNYSEGFGQYMRSFEAVCNTKELATVLKEKIDRPHKGWPRRCLITEVELNRLLLEEEQEDMKLSWEMEAIGNLGEDNG